MTLFKK